MMAELKPCPFCGGNPFVYYSGSPSNGTFAEIICKECGCQTQRMLYSEAIEVWNRRCENEELKFTRQFIHEHGLEFELASAWERRKKDGNT